MVERTRIFISAGEASGDNYGALILQALRERIPSAEFFGCAGTRLTAAGCEAVVDASAITMVGLLEVIPGLPRAWRALQRLRRAIRERRPQLAILIDFPDFNLRLADELKRQGVPVLYFVAPQVWAWRKGRLATIRRVVDRLLCLFPFEEDFFRKAGVNAEFVGHPLTSRARAAHQRTEYLRSIGVSEGNTVIALLPGSRRKEVSLNLPPMLEAARILSASRACEFILPAAPTLDPVWLRTQLGSLASNVHVGSNSFYDAVAHSDAAIVASGTASTEAAIVGTPMVIVYRVSKLSWFLGRRLVNIPYFSIVNLVAGREVVREFIQDKFTGPAVAAEIQRILDSTPLRETLQAGLEEVTRSLAGSPRSGGQTPPQAVAEISDPIQRAAAIAESMLNRGS
jgi:lipid-A-disaccharide synthase